MKIKHTIILAFTLLICVAVSLAIGSGNKTKHKCGMPENQAHRDAHDDCGSHPPVHAAKPDAHDTCEGHSPVHAAKSNAHDTCKGHSPVHAAKSDAHDTCEGHSPVHEAEPDDHGLHHDEAEDRDHENHGTPACSDEKGHGHAHGVDGSVSVEARAAKHCEHAVPVYQCDECRYEAGIVRVESGLLKQENGAGLLSTQPVSRMNASASLHATGEVALNENATTHVSPRISGIINTVAVDTGMRVKAGDTLFTLNSVELGRALAEYERSLTLTDLAEKVLKRETRLRKEKVSSEQDMIEAQMAYEQHRTDLLASEQTLHVLGLTEEDLAVIRQAPHGVNAGRLTVRASIGGTVIERHAVSGELVEPGSEVMLISDTSKVWVWANLYSRDLETLLSTRQHTPARAVVTVPAFPDRQFTGTVDYIGAVMDEDTRTVKVRINVPNPEHLLRPGMFCDVEIAISRGKSEEVVAVPRTAILSDEGRSFVFTHWKEDLYALKNIHTGREFLGMVEIVSGLQAGETVVSEGGFLLKSDILRAKMGAGCADH